MWIETIEPEWPLVNSDKVVAIRLTEIEEKAATHPELWGVYAYCKADKKDEEWVFELFKGSRIEAKGHLMHLVRDLAASGAPAARR